MRDKLIFSNTYKRGSVTFLVFGDEGKFTGVCLEFDLIVQGDTLDEARDLIEDYAKAWLENAIKNQLPEDVLNRPAPKKYWDVLKAISSRSKIKAKIATKKALKAKTVSTHSAFALSAIEYTPQSRLIFA